MAILGRNASVKLTEVLIADMANWSIEITADPIVEPVFGDTWSTTHGLAATAWTASVEGLYDPTDTTGQLVLENAVISGTKLTTLRFYEDDTHYWATTASGAGCYITSMPITVAQGDVGRISFSVQGTGEITRV